MEAVNSLYEILRPTKVIELFQRHLQTIDPNRVESVNQKLLTYGHHEYDIEEGGVVIVEDYFDSDLRRIIQAIEINVVDELRNLKVTPELTVAQINSTLRNIVFELQKKHLILYNQGFLISKTLNALNSFINSIEHEIIPKNRKAVLQDFKGYTIIYSGFKKQLVFLNDLFGFLQNEGLINKFHKDSFISLFTNNWNQKQIIWNGLPRDFGGFYKTLFCKVDTYHQNLINDKGWHLKKLLVCFIVKDEEGLRMNASNIRECITHIKTNKLYNDVISLMDAHLVPQTKLT